MEWFKNEDKKPDTTRDVLVNDEDGSFAVAYFNGKEWKASSDLLECDSYDGGGIVKLDQASVCYWAELPSKAEIYIGLRGNRLVAKRFKTDRKYKRNIITMCLDSILDVYERVKYRKQSKSLEKFANEAEATKARMEGYLEFIEKIRNTREESK